MRSIRKQTLLLLALLIFSLSSHSQAQIVNKVLAVVGDKVITDYQVLSFNPSKVKEIYAIEDKAARNKALKEYKTKTLDFLVEQYTMVIAAESEGIRVSDEEVDRAVEEVLENNDLTLEELEQVLKNENQTLKGYKWQIKMDILKSRIRSKVLGPKVVVTKTDVNQYILGHQEEFDLTDQYELRMLRVESEDALNRAMAQYEETDDFPGVVKEFSGDDEGGYLGWFEYSALDPSLQNILNEKREGDITETVKSPGDYRVFYIQGYKDKLEGTDEIRDQVTDKIAGKRIGKLYEKWLAESKEKILIRYIR
ncbi:peptidylprolyl isomerase [Limisalsivibrio acetivorans]|uniref:peptidylprolyl isomerase n=1 Tax=Limisalsivibrio acetivorans TaxID=1304888 RepID=UPI0003B3164F|nr:SurA N-terminal domain-containing protein [Limisalsivibrio acetivorans]